MNGTFIFALTSLIRCNAMGGISISLSLFPQYYEEYFTFLSAYVPVCLCPVHLNRGIRIVRAKHARKYTENAESQIINGPLSDQPDCDHSNALKSNWTRDDVGKRLGPCDRNEISANFGINFLQFLPFSVNPQIRCRDKKTHQHIILAVLGRPICC